MNGTLAQLLSLVSYGNDFLHTGRIPENYYPDNIAFKFCNQVNFLHLHTRPDDTSAETEAAANPAAWFGLLRRQDCRKLSAYYHPSQGNATHTPDHKLAGFIGGGTWLIETVHRNYSEFWSPRWKVTQADDPQRNIWSVNYGRTSAESAIIDFCPEVAAVKADLEKALTDIEAFAAGQKLENWTKIFGQALERLHSDMPSEGWYQDLLVTSNYSVPALQLLYAAMAANVFGGMGSWNDLGFEKPEDNQTYDDLSAQLYDRMNRAFISSINSSR